MDLIGKQIGNYVVRRRLGAGGMGTVYLCEHPLLGRKVALKVLHEEHAREPSTVDRFFHEAKAANDIRHPNIVEVYDFGWLPGTAGAPSTVYLVMELLEGRSLAAAIPTLSIEEALHVTRQCCKALAASHEKGIVHRDLKPENIFLVRQGDDASFVKIVDFGIAKLLSPSEGGKTQLGTVLGTPAYMSPEQCEGLGRVDHRADIYSLGVVMFEMMTKQVPFHADNFAKIALAHMSQPPPRPAQLNPRIAPEIEAIILHALEKEPGKRFQSMVELMAAIDDPATHLLGYRNVHAEQPTLRAGRAGNTLMIGAEAPPAPVLRETTLQHAAAQVETSPPPPPPRHRGRWLFLGVAGAALIAGIVAATVAGDRGGTVPLPLPLPRPATTAPAPVPAPLPVAQVVPDAAPPPVEWLSVVLGSEPSGATVTRADGAVLGQTPLTVRLERGAPPLDVILSRQGYTSVRRLVAPDDGEILLVLDAIPPPEPRKPARRVHRDLKPIEL